MNERTFQFTSFDRRPDAIAIDLDGTLLDSQTRLSTRNRRSLERCLTQGIPIVIATSRPVRILNRIFPEELAAACSLAMMNGEVAEGRPPLTGYFVEALTEEVAQSILDLAVALDPSIRITVELEGNEFGANWKADPVTLWQRNSATPDMVLSIEEALRRQPCKMALGGPAADLVKLTDKITQSFGNVIAAIPAPMEVISRIGVRLVMQVDPYKPRMLLEDFLRWI